MSFRSSAGSDITLGNVTITGYLDLENPIVYDDFEVDNLVVKLSMLPQV